MPTAEYDKAYFINMTGALEGNFSYMYSDSEGNITVGIGCLLSSAKDAAALPFVQRNTSKRATSQEITDQFQSLSAMNLRRLKAEAQKDYTSLDLPIEAVTSLMATRLVAFEESLRRYFGPDWLAMPTEGKMGLLSMTYGAGFGSMLRKYLPILQAAAVKIKAIDKSQTRQGDWKRIVDACADRIYFLPNVSADRAQWTRELFAACIDMDRLLVMAV